MAKKSGLGQNIYIAGYDLSGDIASVDNIGSPRNVVEVTGLNKSAMERLLTYGDGYMSLTSYFNDATGQAHTNFSDVSAATANELTMYTMGTTRGDAAMTLVGRQLNYDGSRPEDGSLTFGVETQGDQVPLEYGVLLTAGKVTHSSSASTSSVDGGAQTTAGAALMIQSFSLSSGTAVVTVQDSSNNSSWGTLKAFTNVASATASGRVAERVTIAGNIERYVRVTTSGTFSALVFAVALTRGTAQDDTTYTTS